MKVLASARACQHGCHSWEARHGSGNAAFMERAEKSAGEECSFFIHSGGVGGGFAGAAIIPRGWY